MTTLEKIRAEIKKRYDDCEEDWENGEQYGYWNCLKIVEKYAEQEPTTGQSCENCKILELLVGMEIPTICEDDYNDCEYCEQNCNFKAPTKECYLHWAEHKRKAVSKCHTV